VTEHERDDIINESHAGAVRDHFQADMTTRKILQEGRHDRNKDCRDQVIKHDICQRLGRPLWKNEMPLSSINSNQDFVPSTSYCGQICD
jgi:hypothetical protein